MFRYTVPYLFKVLYPSLVWELPVTEPAVFITFDDGPHPEITPWVCSQLDQYQGKGTFFCVGENVQRYPDVFNRLVQEGHTVGNHTFHHKNGWKTPDEEYLQSVQRCADLVSTPLFRPPYGRIRPSQLKTLREKYKIIMWSLLSRDFEADLNTDEALQALKKHTVPGSIIVFHDSKKAEKNLKTLLPPFLAFCHSKGYLLKKIS